MYKAVIVDDEPDVREGLQLLVDWREHGFEVVGEAANGAEALENMPLWRPNFVVTDIRMPVLDGLEYIRKIREQFPDIEIVVISAHGEFHYAREAMLLGVLDFLLKPIAGHALRSCMEKVKRQLDERQRIRGRERVQRQFIQEKWLQALCHGQLRNPGQWKLVGDGFHHAGDNPFQVLLVEMDDFEGYAAECTEADLDLKRYMVRNIAEEIAAEYGVPQVYEDSPERTGLLLQVGQRKDTELKKLCEDIRDALKQFVHISVSIGVGKPRSGWKEIARSYQEALRALEYMLLEGKGGIFFYDQLQPFLPSIPVEEFDGLPLYRSDTFIQAVEEMDETRMNVELDLFFQMLKTRAHSPDIARGLSLELVMGLVRLVREHNGDTRKIFGDRLQEYDRVFVKRSMPALRHWLDDLSRRTSRYLSGLRAAQLPDVMEEVRQWIDEHYAEDISLKMIAARVYKNPVYLGQLFKSTFGESFSRYVTKLRIRKAQQLLRRSQLRVYEIAELVGYGTLDTFYQKFRQVTGMNPTEYKQKTNPPQEEPPYI